MTNSQINALHFADQPNVAGELRTERGAQSAGNRALRRLWEGGYIHRQPVVLTSRQGLPYLHFVNILTLSGIAAVQEWYDAAGRGQQVRSTEPPALQNQQLNHQLAINDAHIALSRGARRSGVRFTHWHDDRQLTALNRERTTAFLSIPDALFVLQRGGSTPANRFYFLELDLGTMSVFGVTVNRAGWRAKIARYEQYFDRSFAGEAYFDGLPSPAVLCVTRSSEHLDNLIDATREAAGARAGRYWLTTLDELAADALETPWMAGDGTMGHTLLRSLGVR